MAMPTLHEEAKLTDTLCHKTFGITELKDEAGKVARPAGPWPCKGSPCMAWRFARTNIFDGDTKGTKVSDDTHGYCGDAGLPGQN